MIYYVGGIMTRKMNNELADATIALSKQYKGTKAAERWMSGEDSPLNSWFMPDIEYPDIARHLSDRLCDAMSQICDSLNMDYKVKPAEFWYNVYDNTQYQEMHMHSPSIFSIVYFNKMPEGSAPFAFEDKEMDLDKQTEGSAIIFPSYLMHGVERGTNTEPRITWAMNFQ